MKILSREQIKEADAYTIANEPISSIALMERASSVCAKWITSRFYTNTRFHVVCGMGNNGGDGLAIARLLFNSGFKNIKITSVNLGFNPTADFTVNLKRVQDLGLNCTEISNASQIPNFHDDEVLFDAIFGIGLNRKLDGLAKELVSAMNKSGKNIISIDIPSGLSADNEFETVDAVRASHTLTFECTKLAFMFPENAPFVGDFSILPIGLHADYHQKASTKYFFTTNLEAKLLLQNRAKFSHKGTNGHSLLIGGSFGKIGAMVLASEACIYSGSGLTTVYVPKVGYTILQTAIPEAMAICDEEENHLSTCPKLVNYSAIGVGPGMGKEEESHKVLKVLIQEAKTPLVIDADGLNILSENKTWLSFLPKNTILTPHPKEFDRLTETHTNSFERLNTAKIFSTKHGVIVVLKGAHTAVVCPDGNVFFNSTGNPALATGGSGDVLTGILTGLLAQGYSPQSAAILGVYLHGLAADIYTETTGITMKASDISKMLPLAFKHLG